MWGNADKIYAQCIQCMQRPTVSVGVNERLVPHQCPMYTHVWHSGEWHHRKNSWFFCSFNAHSWEMSNTGSFFKKTTHLYTKHCRWTAHLLQQTLFNLYFEVFFCLFYFFSMTAGFSVLFFFSKNFCSFNYFFLFSHFFFFQFFSISFHCLTICHSILFRRKLVFHPMS